MEKKKHPLWIQVAGWVGTVLLLGSYTLNSFGVIDSQEMIYPALNLFAGAALGIRVYADRNYSNLVMEFFWVSVAVVSIIKIFIS